MFVETKDLITIESRPKRFSALAEAIRRGAAKTEQCPAVYINYAGATCAIGAAAIGSGYDQKSSHWVAYHSVVKHMDAVFGNGWSDQLVDGTTIFELITRKNDTGMSREKIADWLDTLD